MTGLSDSGGSELDWNQSGKTAGRTWAPVIREEKSWENKHDNQKPHQSLKLKTRETQNNPRLELNTINMNRNVLILLKISRQLKNRSADPETWEWNSNTIKPQIIHQDGQNAASCIHVWEQWNYDPHAFICIAFDNKFQSCFINDKLKASEVRSN